MDQQQLLSFFDSDEDEDEMFEMVMQRRRKKNKIQSKNLILSEKVIEIFSRNSRGCIKGYVNSVVSTYSEKEFIMHFRLSGKLVDYLVQEFQKNKEFRKLRRNGRLRSAKEHILLFLWFAGHESSCFRDIADRFDVTISTVHRMVKRVASFISSLSKDVIKWPDQNEAKLSAEQFFQLSGFPGVIGCIDGSHIKIDPPKSGKDEYIDRKGDVTIHLQAICNENRKLLDIFIGYPASVHDSRVFLNSPIYEELPLKCLEEHHLLGDSAYACSNSLLTPYKDNGHLTAAEKRYNRKLSIGRVKIEHTFGVLKQRFRQLYHCKLKGIKEICHFVRAVCVLHNMADLDDLALFEPATKENVDEQERKVAQRD
uniref:Nuclease HARBI1 n=1 Tax=Diabrotica virgifera virgifera TaxID=50390 RepID=A0A6P7HA58_DIAVI